MNLYLVREAGTTKVHGIFWADNAAALWDAVDEMADPAFFEWTEIEQASGVWRDEALEEARPIPDRGAFPESAEGEETFDTALNKALAFGFSTFGDRFWQAVVYQEEREWTRFDYADQGVGVIARTFEEAA